MSELLTPPLLFIDLGLCEYRQAWKLQQKIHTLCVQGHLRGAILLVQHPSVITLGRNADRQYILEPEVQLASEGITVVPIDRGGEVTAHNPGQLVVYPILPLREFRLSPKKLVDLLEEIVILTLRRFDIEGVRSDVNPGVWVDQDKICALGIRIKERVSLHGFALNIHNDLNLFRKIVPCGIQDHGVTSMTKVLGYPVSWEDVVSSVVDLFKMKLDSSGGKASIMPTADQGWLIRPDGFHDLKI